MKSEPDFKPDFDFKVPGTLSIHVPPGDLMILLEYVYRDPKKPMSIFSTMIDPVIPVDPSSLSPYDLGHFVTFTCQLDPNSSADSNDIIIVYEDLVELFLEMVPHFPLCWTETGGKPSWISCDESLLPKIEPLLIALQKKRRSEGPEDGEDPIDLLPKDLPKGPRWMN